jgi:pimeloyl-ACP methyl ester carboxylesterase
MIGPAMSGISWLLSALYTLLPVGLLLFALYRWWRWGQFRPLAAVLSVCLLGTGCGLAVVGAYAWLLGGEPAPREILRAAWVGVAVCGLLRCVDWISTGLLIRGLRGRHGLGWRLTGVGLVLLQRVAMLALAVLWCGGVLLALRPRIIGGPDPQTLGMVCRPVMLHTADGLDLAAWYLPGDSSAGRDSAVILCHGLGARKESMLPLAGMLAARGHNVLALDFRAHGRSASHTVTFGQREQLDVLAAVAYLRSLPQPPARIAAVGVNTGAAALLGAAADPNTGQSLDALVLAEPFADLTDVSVDVLCRPLPRTGPLAAAGRALRAGNGWVMRLVLRIAGWHAGADLAGYRPVAGAEAVWPRPVLVVHGRGVGPVPPEQELILTRALAWPPQEFWPSMPDLSRRQRARDELALLRLILRQWLGLEGEGLEDPGTLQRIADFLDHPPPRDTLVLGGRAFAGAGAPAA